MLNIMESFQRVKLTETFGWRLKKRREEIGLDQNALANLIGADQPTISRWENDKIFPSPPYQEKLAGILKVDPSFFDESDVVYEAPSDPADALWPSIINRMAALEEQVRQLKAEKQKSDLAHVNPDLEKFAALLPDADLVTLYACLYLLTGSKDDLLRVHNVVRSEIQLLYKHLEPLRPAKVSDE